MPALMRPPAGPGQKATDTMTTTTAILAAITTVTVSLDPHSADLIDTARFAAELTKVFPAAEVEVSRATSHETRLDARGELDGEAVRIIARGRSYDVLGEVDAPSDAPETIDALVEAAWDRACG
jgi:hypothetical protein